MLVFALTLATALHAAGLWVSGKRAPIRIESGAGAAEARLGSSFADMAAGRAQPASNSTVTPNRQADEEVTPTDPGQALRPETPAAADAAPVEMASTAALSAPASVATSATAIPAAPPPTAALAPDAPPLKGAVDPPARADTPPARPADAPAIDDRSVPVPAPEAARPVATEKAVTATSRKAEGLQVSRRPKTRPATVEEAARKGRAAKAAARQSREPDGAAQVQGSAGSDAGRNAIRGSATATQEATARQAGRDTARQTETGGNAAASNYPGVVMARLARVPRPRVDGRGTAVVRFTIAPDGGLAGVSVTRGSGSARLDRAALTVVRRAAPFPRPPSGAQRSFSVTIEGR